jgi:hypothetical protein
VKRRGSTACKNVKIENFDQLKDEFIERIDKTVNDFEIATAITICHLITALLSLNTVT